MLYNIDKMMCQQFSRDVGLVYAHSFVSHYVNTHFTFSNPCNSNTVADVPVPRLDYPRKHAIALKSRKRVFKAGIQSWRLLYNYASGYAPGILCHYLIALVGRSH